MKKSLANGIWKLENIIFYSLILFLPTQLGKHFWPDFSSVLGIRVDYLSPTIYFTDVLVFLLFGIWVVRILIENLVRKSKIKNQKSKLQFKIKNHYSTLVFISVTCYLLLVICFSGRVWGGLYSLLKFLEMSFVAYYIAKFIDLKKVLPKIIIFLSVGVVAESAIAVFQYLIHGSIGGILYYLGERTFNASTPGIANASLNGELVLRPYGTFPHPNVLAGYLVVVMILVLFSLRYRKPQKELRIKKQEASFARKIIFPLIHNSYFLIQIGALILGSVALVLSMSRVAILLWILILGYFFLKKIKLKLYLFLVLGISILFLLSPLGARFTKIANTDEAILQRGILIERTFDMLKSSPLLGMGLGNFIPKLATIQKPLSLGSYLQPVHNVFLLVTAETGLIGFGFFSWFLWKTYKAANGKWQMANGIFFSFLTILILGLFDHYFLTLQQGQLLFAFVTSLSYASNSDKNFS